MVTPLEYAATAGADMAELAPALRPAVLEQLTRIATDWKSCSRTTSFPYPPGYESCLWLRHADGKATLLEVLFSFRAKPDRIVVRRVKVRDLDRLPDWVSRPDEWGAYPPYPVVDL